MSYILDALRKADAQRAANPARGIHAQTLHASNGQPNRPGAYSPWLWVGAAAALVALSSAAWYLSRDKADGAPARQDRVELAAGTAAPSASVPQRQSAPPPARVPAPAVAPVAAPAIQPPPPPPNPGFTAPAGNSRVTSLPMMRGSQPATPGAPAAPQSGLSQLQRQAPARDPAGPAVSTPATPAPQAGVPPAAPMTQAPPQAMPTAPTTPIAVPAQRPMAVPSAGAVSAPVAPAQPTPPVAGLPPDAPKLVLTGGVFSKNPAQRMLIVNGQVFNEGSEVGPGVVLEEVKAKTAVLRFRGSRYTVPY
jgi:general secretion pathway protein B